MIGRHGVIAVGADGLGESGDRALNVPQPHRRSTRQVVTDRDRAGTPCRPITAPLGFGKIALPQVADAQVVPAQAFVAVAVQRFSASLDGAGITPPRSPARRANAASHMPRIAGQGQFVVRAGLAAIGRPVELAAFQIQLFDAQGLIRPLGELGRVRRINVRDRQRRGKRGQHAPRRARDRHVDRPLGFVGQGHHRRRSGRQIQLLTHLRLSVPGQHAHRSVVFRGRQQSQFQPPVAACRLGRQVLVGKFKPIAQTMDRIPILLPGDPLVRTQHPIVRLRGQRTALHFDVRPVVVGQVLLSNLAELPLAPRPGFFAAQFLMVGDLNDAAVGVNVVGAEEVVRAIHGEHRGIHLVVLEPRQVAPLVDRPAKELAARCDPFPGSSGR